MKKVFSSIFVVLIILVSIGFASAQPTESDGGRGRNSDQCISLTKKGKVLEQDQEVPAGDRIIAICCGDNKYENCKKSESTQQETSIQQETITEEQNLEMTLFIDRLLKLIKRSENIDPISSDLMFKEIDNDITRLLVDYYPKSESLLIDARLTLTSNKHPLADKIDWDFLIDRSRKIYELSNIFNKIVWDLRSKEFDHDIKFSGPEQIQRLLLNIAAAMNDDLYIPDKSMITIALEKTQDMVVVNYIENDLTSIVAKSSVERYIEKEDFGILIRDENDLVYNEINNLEFVKRIKKTKSDIDRDPIVYGMITMLPIVSDVDLAASAVNNLDQGYYLSAAGYGSLAMLPFLGKFKDIIKSVKRGINPELRGLSRVGETSLSIESQILRNIDDFKAMYPEIPEVRLSPIFKDGKIEKMLVDVGYIPDNVGFTRISGIKLHPDEFMKFKKAGWTINEMNQRLERGGNGVLRIKPKSTSTSLLFKGRPKENIPEIIPQRPTLSRILLRRRREIENQITNRVDQGYDIETAMFEVVGGSTKKDINKVVEGSRKAGGMYISPSGRIYPNSIDGFLPEIPPP